MTTSDYYRARIQESLEYIDQHLSEKFTAIDVATVASFSEYHFHRLFPAFMGESIHQYVRRRRLEKAAQLLVDQPTFRLLDVAIEVGFETHSAFSRAFKQEFGISPSKFKKSNGLEITSLKRPNLMTSVTQEFKLTPSIQLLPQLHFLYWVAKGTASGQFFSDSRPDAELANLVQQSNQSLIGVASAFPSTPQSLNDLSAEVWYGGLYTAPAVNQREGCSVQIGAGQWVVFEYKGAYEYLHQAWNQIYRAWLPNSGQTLRDTLPFEMYLNSPQIVIPSELLTQIWLPIE